MWGFTCGEETFDLHTFEYAQITLDGHRENTDCEEIHALVDNGVNCTQPGCTEAYIKANGNVLPGTAKTAAEKYAEEYVPPEQVESD